VGQNIKRIRQEQGLTQEQLAERFAFSQRSISGLEQGRRNPTIVSLYEERLDPTKGAAILLGNQPAVKTTTRLWATEARLRGRLAGRKICRKIPTIPARVMLCRAAVYSNRSVWPAPQRRFRRARLCQSTRRQRAHPVQPAVGEALEALTASEADVLEAIVARLIPTDENGPGAREARAAHYIDRALAGPLSSSRSAYIVGLAAVDAYAQAVKSRPFSELSPADQDAVLQDMEKNVATGFMPNSSVFFEMVRTHTIQGTFCDPYYGGNANFLGWDLIGYPGIRMAVSEDEQRMKEKPTAIRNSAYDSEMFTMKGDSHGH